MSSSPPEQSEFPEPPAPPRSALRRLLNRFEVDRAVFYAIAARGWQILAGPVTVYLIAKHFTREIQGVYYPFWNLVALHTYVELGFYIVILNVASHEWDRLRLEPDGRIVGDPEALSRLISLGRLVFAWFAVAGLIFTIGVGVLGYAMFSRQAITVDWLAPWLVLVVLMGMLLWILPFNALLEGCNQIGVVNHFRFYQAIAGNIGVWLSISLGWGLWTAVVATLVRLVCELILVGWHYRRFFAPFFQPPAGPRIDWATEIWPMQWRVAMKQIPLYFTTNLFTLVALNYYGTAVSGQMGMTWQILTSLQATALSWVQTRAPRFGMLVARRDYAELDRLFWRVTIISVGLLSFVAGAFWAANWLLHEIDHPVAQQIAERLLPPLPTFVFVLVIVLSQIPTCQWIYIHAHKQSPYMRLSIASSIVVGLVIWYFGKEYGPIGSGLANLAVIVGFSLPVWTLVWLRLRAEWHQPPHDVDQPEAQARELAE